MPLVSPHRRRIAARLIAGWLACALAICGLASVRIAMLGTNHVHLHATETAQAMAGWQDFRRGAHLGGARAHHHAFFERHHHAAVDTSVASTDAAASAAASGDTSGSTTASVPVLALACAPDRSAAPALTGTDARWAAASARGIERIEAGRLERPPRA